MAEYHLTMKNISRSDGRNAVKSAAYRHGQKYSCDRTNEVYNYSKKKDVEHCEISIPENSPKWAKELADLNPHQASQKLWNAVEGIEKRKDARLSKEVEFSLPHELTKEQRLILAREFINENFTSKGMIADWAVHNHFDEKDGIEKPHVHVMLTTRVLKENSKESLSFGGEVYSTKDIAFGEKDRSWNHNDLLRTIRQNWEVCANKHLEKAGLDVRIDHRSYEDRGIDLEAQPKIGKAPEEMARRGYTVNRLEELERVKEKNRKLITQNPEMVLDYITRQQSVFTGREIERVINRYIDEPEEAQRLFSRIEASSQLVRISDDRVGEPQKFTTREMIDLELSLMKKAETLRKTPIAAVPSYSQSWFVVDANDKMKAKHQGKLSSDQVEAIYHMTDKGQLKVVVGYAGAGKSTCLKITKDIWEEEGYRVVGAAPTGKAADNLEGTGISSKTLHKWEQEWKTDQSLLGKKDIFVVDEAGMIDSRRLNGLLERAQKDGFKVVLVGDPEQLSPIEAGCGLRTVMDKAGFVQMNTIQRQHEEWQKEATRSLATKQTQLALKKYEEKGCVHLIQNAKDKLIEDYALQMKTKLSEESLGFLGDSVILAYTNRDVQDLNQRARAVARESGRLSGPDHLLTVSRYANEDSLDPRESSLLKIRKEEKPFAVGDQIVFLRNDYGIGVKNGQFGVIQKIDEGMIHVEVDKFQEITFDLSLYSSFDHGYATTIHKSQASTVNKTFLYTGQGMDRHLTYVGLSRHRQEAHLYADTDVFKTHEHLYDHLSRENSKENALDYNLDSSLDSNLQRPLSPPLSNAPFYPHPLTGFEKIGAWVETAIDKTLDKAKVWLQGEPSMPQEEKPVPETFQESPRQSFSKQSLSRPSLSRQGLSRQDFLRSDSYEQDEKGLVLSSLSLEEQVLKNQSFKDKESMKVSFSFEVREKERLHKDPSIIQTPAISERSQDQKSFVLSELEISGLKNQDAGSLPQNHKNKGHDSSLSSPETISSFKSSLSPPKAAPFAFVDKIRTNPYQQERHDSILNYLKEEVRLDKQAWLKESSLAFFLEGAEKDPMKALKRWQDVTGDRSFIPMTKEEEMIKTMQAQELLKTAQANLSKEEFKTLSETLPNHTGGILLKCQKALDDHQDRQRDLDAEKFMSLSRRYHQEDSGFLKSNSLEKQSIRKTIKDLSLKYEKDEAFLKKIEGFNDKVIKEAALELFRNEDLKREKTRSLGRGFDMGF